MAYAPRTLEKKVSSTVDGWDVLEILDRSCGLIVLCVFVSLLTFCLAVLSTVETGVLKSPTVILYPPI